MCTNGVPGKLACGTAVRFGVARHASGINASATGAEEACVRCGTLEQPGDVGVVSVVGVVPGLGVAFCGSACLGG